MHEVRDRLRRAGAEMTDIDGVRVRTRDGWWLLRASNTQAVLVARAESANEEGLARLKTELAAQLAASGVQLPEDDCPSPSRNSKRRRAGGRGVDYRLATFTGADGSTEHSIFFLRSAAQALCASCGEKFSKRAR